MPNLAVAQEPAAVEMELLSWMAVHGAICLALRHPRMSAPSHRTSRAMLLAFIEGLETLMRERGLLTADEIHQVHRVEDDARRAIEAVGLGEIAP